MQQRVFDAENIEIHWNTEAEEVLGEQEVEGMRVVNNVTGEKSEISIQGFFVAIGHQPNTQIFNDFLSMDDVGYIVTEPGTTKNQY